MPPPGSLMPDAARIGLQKLATAWALFQGLVLEALPFLLIGVVIAGLARWLTPGSRWIQRLPSGPLLGPVTGAVLGFALPACECGNVPVARRLLAGGAPLGTALGFLFAAPVLNPVVLISTWAAFPNQPWLCMARPSAALVLALLLASLLRLLPEGELLDRLLMEERRLSQPLGTVGLLERRSGVLGSPVALPASVRRPTIAEVMQHSQKEFLDLSGLLLLGCAVAASVQTLLPRSLLLEVGGAPTLSILSLMLLAIVVSVCSSVDAFLALGFASLVTPGALLAFLVLGPVVDLKLLGLFGALLRPKAVALMATGAGLCVLLIGQWINLLML